MSLEERLSLKERLLQDMKESLKEKDSVRKDTIQIVRAGVLQIEKDQKIEVDDDGVMDVVTREIKKRLDVLPDYEKSGRDDSVLEINRQIEILKSYLPEQLSSEEIEAIVDATVKEIGASSMKDMGKVMGALASKLKGKADNKLVSELVKKALS